ncbi:hypothetical protein BDV97DRAFT_397806 [Delphinella strobiligena]|nr:hypothetical protein BDV97DRAFT_397806 [Delphinella strobiligena]
MSRSPWTAETDRKMLLIMLKDTGAKFDLASIASQLTTDTWQCTAKAVENRYYRLKTLAKAFDEEGAKGAPENGEAATAEPKTSKKRGRKAATAKGKETNVDNEDDEEKAPPKKRARKAAIPKEGMNKEDVPERKDDEQQVSESAFDDGEEQGQTMVKDEPITS